MDAGRELDALIAEKVMGLTRVAQGEPYFWPSAEAVASLRRDHPDVLAVDYFPAPEYSTDIAVAWQVVERTIANEHGFELWRPNTGGFSFSYEAKFYTGGAEFIGHAETAPLAICRAALAAVALVVTR